MTQPGPPTGFSRLETLYTQALRLLGVVGPGNIALDSPNTIANVQVLADVSDVTIPHQNPLFSFSAGIGAPGAGVNLGFELEATSRPLRVWTVFLSAGTDVRIGVTAASILTTVNAVVQCGSLGPIGDALVATTGQHTANVRRGSSVGAAPPFGVLSTFLPEQIQWNANKFLVAPGNFFTVESITSNAAVTVAWIWEEIPDQNESQNLGFPEAGNP